MNQTVSEIVAPLVETEGNSSVCIEGCSKYITCITFNTGWNINTYLVSALAIQFIYNLCNVTLYRSVKSEAKDCINNNVIFIIEIINNRNCII